MDGEKTPETRKPRVFYGWYIVAITWMPLFLISALAFAIFFKPILGEFRLDRAELSLVQSVAMLAFAAVSPFIGRLIDRFGPKSLLLASMSAQVLSSAITGLAGSIWHLYIARFLFETRPLFSTQVLINRWFVRKRGRALGISAASLPIGMLALSPVSQYLVQAWGWRETLLFWSAVALVMMVPLIIFIKDKPEDKGYSPDGEPSGPAGPTPSIAAATAAKGPRLTEAVASSSFWLLSATHLICGIGCGFVMTHIVIFTTDVGYTAMIGASLLSVIGAVNLVGVLVTGHISDRISRSKVLSLTHFVRSLAFITVVIFIIMGGGSLWLLYLAVAMFGFGYFTTSPLAAGLVADLFGNLRMGTIMGIVFSCHMIGTAIGSYAGGITFELTGSYYPFFLTQGGLEFLAAIFAFAIKRRKSTKAAVILP